MQKKYIFFYGDKRKCAQSSSLEYIYNFINKTKGKIHNNYPFICILYDMDLKTPPKRRLELSKIITIITTYTTNIVP